MAKRVNRPAKSKQPVLQAISKKMQLEYLDITDIAPYEFNPRDNQPAIASVANSIKNFGFLVPVVVDHDSVIVAGHTRVEAAKTLGMTEVPVIRAAHLTPDQANAFRLIDNKVSELAKWDFDLLSDELGKLSNSGLLMTDFGWTREELDCLTQVVAADCLSASGLVDDASRDRIRRAERRAPAQARFTLGELVFFLPQQQYRSWIDGLRAQHDFVEAAICEDVKRRLGILS